jgi:hypothetical protein
MSQKNNFRKTWKTLTELGEEFGVSAVKFGNLLKEHGLREKTGEPSEKAKEGQFFEKIVPKDGKPYYLWHRQKTSDYLISLGVAKSGVSVKEAESMTEARQLARSYLEAQKLDSEGNKLGYLMYDELVPEIKKVGLEKFNKALKSVGYKGSEVTLDNS